MAGVLVLYYSSYGHMEPMAYAAARFQGRLVATTATMLAAGG
jgi:hypothetical protein